MKKLIFLSIAGLFGLIASAQTSVSFPGRLKNEEGEITGDKGGNTKVKFRCDPWYQNETCVKIDSSGPILMPNRLVKLSLYINNSVSQVLNLENYQGVEYKERSKETEVAIYYKPDNNGN